MASADRSIATTCQRRCNRDGVPGTMRVSAGFPGPAFEDVVSGVIRRIAPASAADPLALPVRVEVHAESLQILMPVTLLATLRSRLAPGETAEPDAADGALLRLILAGAHALRGGRSWIIGGTSPLSRRDPVLIRALRAAHAMLGADAARSSRDRGRSAIALSPPPGKTRLSCAGSATRHPRREATARPHLEQLMRTPMPGLWSEQGAMIEALGAAGAPPDHASGPCSRISRKYLLSASTCLRATRREA